MPFQYFCGGVAVGGSFLVFIIFLHGLIIQILAIHDEKHLINKGQPRGNASRLKGGQRLAGAGRVPYVAARRDTAIFFVVMGNFYSVDDSFGRRDLIGAHNH